MKVFLMSFSLSCVSWDKNSTLHLDFGSPAKQSNEMLFLVNMKDVRFCVVFATSGDMKSNAVVISTYSMTMANFF